MVSRAASFCCKAFNFNGGTTISGFKGVVTIHGDRVHKQPLSAETADSIQKEADILDYLRLTNGDSGLQRYVPEFLGLSEVNSSFFMSRIQGNVLAYNGDYDSFLPLDEGQQESISAQIADFLVRLHSLVIPERQQSVWTVTDDFLEPRTAQEKIEEQAYYFSGFPDVKYRLDRATDYLVSSDTLADKKALVHRDLHANNILFDRRSSQVGIVDFDCSGYGYRHLDFMKLYNCFPEKIRERVIELYEGDMGEHVEREMAQAAGDLYKLYLSSPINSRSPFLSPVFA